jgi:hypothetical protein
MPISDAPSGCPRPRWLFVLLMTAAWIAAAGAVRATLSPFSPDPSDREGRNFAADLLLAGLGGVAFGGTIILVRSPLSRLVLFPVGCLALQAAYLHLRAAALGHGRDSYFQMSFWSAGGAVPESVLLMAGYEIFAGERIPRVSGRAFGGGLALFAGLGGIVGVLSALSQSPFSYGNPAFSMTTLVLAAAGPLEFFVILYLAIRAVHRRSGPARSECPAGPEGRDPGTEAHLRAIALWFVVGGAGFGLSALVALALGQESDFLDLSGDSPQIFWSAVAVLVPMAAVSLAHAVVGHFLARFRRWARIAGGVLALLLFVWQARQVETFTRPWGSLLAVASVVWLGAVAWTLFGASAARLSTDEYRALVARTPAPALPIHRSPFFWAPLVATVGIAGLVGLGFPL